MPGFAWFCRNAFHEIIMAGSKYVHRESPQTFPPDTRIIIQIALNIFTTCELLTLTSVVM